MPVKSPKFATSTVAPVQQTLAPMPDNPMGDYITPDQVASRKAYADALLADSGAPVQDWSQGVANMVKALVGGTIQRKTGEADKTAKAEGLRRSGDIMTALLSGGGLADPQSRLDAIGGPDSLKSFLSDPNIDPDTKSYVFKLLGEKPPEPEAYTLGPGEQRFQGDQMIAGVPATTDAPDPFTLGPGQQRFDANGNPIAGVPSGDLTFEQRLELEKAGRPQTTNTVTVEGQKYQLPPPPAGFVYRMNQQTGEPALNEQGLPELVPTPGGPVDAENRAAAEKKVVGEETKGLAANVVVQDIDRALSKIEESPGLTTGVGGAVSGWFPGSPSQVTQGLISTIRANVGFDKLQAMRDASPTGGALGQVTLPELEMLQAAMGNLETATDPAVIKDNLRRVKNIYLDIIHGSGKGPPREKLSFEGESAPGQPDAEGWIDMGDGTRVRQK